MKNKYLTFTHHQKLLYACTLALLVLAPVASQAQFTTSMAIPDLYDRRADTLYVDVETHDFGAPGLNNVETMAYNHEFSGQNSYLGPTLTWYVGENQSTHITNRLPDSAGMRTTVHWHGANIPAYTDGGPHQYFDPGESFTAAFPVIDKPTTLWYHPHAEDITYTQVQMGLAGIIIVQERGDTIDAVAPHTYGHDDFPLIIQDIRFIDSTQSIDSTQGPPGSDKERMIVVNGVIDPYLDVFAQPTSFRILDGSTRNAYMLSFVTDTANPGTSRIPFQILASDGGYLPDSTITVFELETGPGIRNRVIVDFASVPGQTLYLMNSPSLLANGLIGKSNAAPLPILQIRVDANTFNPIGAIPPVLAPILAIDTMGPDTSRVILLTGEKGRTGLPFGIDSSQYDFNKINTVVKLNTVEDWIVKNQTPFGHPFHIHLVQFYVMKVVEPDGNVFNLGDADFPVELLGPKDDVLIWPGEEITLRMRFHTYGQPKPFDLDSSAYMYHCHILTHEDGYYRATSNTLGSRAPWGMMQQFAVWNGVTTSVDIPLAEEMTLYPNPTENLLYLHAESPRMSTIRIMDVQGRILMEKVLPPFMGSTPIDVSDIARGMIIVEWSSPDGKQVKKVVLE